MEGPARSPSPRACRGVTLHTSPAAAWVTFRFSLYTEAKGHLKEPPFGKAIANGEIFTSLEREHGNGLLCRLFGAWLPVRDDWKVRPLNVHDNGSGGLSVTIPLKSPRGNRSGAYFFQDKGGFTRYDGDIYYYFLLD
jgi:hypothetical protein